MRRRSRQSSSSSSSSHNSMTMKQNGDTGPSCPHGSAAAHQSPRYHRRYHRRRRRRRLLLFHHSNNSNSDRDVHMRMFRSRIDSQAKHNKKINTRDNARLQYNTFISVSESGRLKRKFSGLRSRWQMLCSLWQYSMPLRIDATTTFDNKEPTTRNGRQHKEGTPRTRQDKTSSIVIFTHRTTTGPSRTEEQQDRELPTRQNHTARYQRINSPLRPSEAQTAYLHFLHKHAQELRNAKNKTPTQDQRHEQKL